MPTAPRTRPHGGSGWLAVLGLLAVAVLAAGSILLAVRVLTPRAGVPLPEAVAALVLATAPVVLLVVGVSLRRIARTDDANLRAHADAERTARELEAVTERGQETHARLAATQHRLGLVTATANDAIFTTDDRGIVVEWNPAASRIFGRADTEALGRLVSELLERAKSDPTRSVRPGLGVDALHHLVGSSVAINGVRASGERFPAELSVASWTDGGRTWYTAFVRDASARVDAERRAREHAARYQDLVEHVPGVVYRRRVRDVSRVEYVSPQIEALTGYTADEWLSTPGLWEAAVHPEDRARYRASEETGTVEPNGSEYRMIRRDGREIWVRDHAGPVPDEDGNPAHWSGLLVDITDQKALEAQLTVQALQDPLTGLANRALFADRIDHALRRTERDSGLVGLVMLDLDDFKTINDTLGHEVGDQLLRAVAARLRELSRAGSTISRLGGDEFAILLEDLDDEEAAMAVAHRIVRAFERPFRIGTNTLLARASVGVVVDAMRRRSADWMLRSADVAMYEAKKKGKGRWQLYDPAAYLAATRRLVLESELRRAAERGRFVLLYQPIVDLETRQIRGAEALLRWSHPTRGLVPPVEFISVLEATGLIVQVGEWALRTAAQQAGEWAERHSAFRSIAVNASARQLADPGFVDAVRNATSAAGIDPALLLVEVTESVALDAAGGGTARLATLREGGTRVAIDDFGTGYSSLAYLRQLPVDTLKIDRAFIAGVGEDPEGTAVAKAIISLASTLRLTTVAEGIETAAQAAILRGLSCDLGQGFLFARPMPASEISVRLANQEAGELAS